MYELRSLIYIAVTDMPFGMSKLSVLRTGTLVKGPLVNVL